MKLKGEKEFPHPPYYINILLFVFSQNIGLMSCNVISINVLRVLNICLYCIGGAPPLLFENIKLTSTSTHIINSTSVDLR